MNTTLTLANILILSALLTLCGLLWKLIVAVNRFLRMVDNKLWQHDRMWLDFAERHGYPVDKELLDRFHIRHIRRHEPKEAT